MQTPLKQYKVGGYSVVLFANRIEIARSSILGRSSDTILLRNITSVDLPLGGMLTIATADGKRTKLSIGGKEAKAMQQAIIEALP